MFLYIPDSCKKPTMTLNSSDSHSQFLLEKIIKMSESAVMSAEESMRSAMLAKEHAISALTAARLMMDLQLGAELSGREVDGLQSNHVSSSTELQDWKDDDDREDDEDTQSVFLSDPAADIVDGGSDSDGEAETAAIVDVLTSSDESEDWRVDGSSHHHQLDQTTTFVSQTVRASAVAGPYIPPPSQLGSMISEQVYLLDEKCKSNDWRNLQTKCPQYRAKEFPVKGRGLFATKKINPGQIIMNKLPLHFCGEKLAGLPERVQAEFPPCPPVGNNVGREILDLYCPLLR